MSTRYIDVVIRARNGMAAALASARSSIVAWSNSVAGGILRAGAAFLSFRALANIGGFIAKQAAESEKAVNDLNSALATHGVNVAKLSPLYQSFAKSIQDMTGRSDEATLATVTQLTNYGVMQTKIPQATQMVIGLSKAFGIEADAAAKVTAQVLQGEFAMVGRYIPAVKSATTDQEKLRIVMEAAEKGFRQQQASLNTTAGAWGALKERFGEAAEEFGGGVAGSTSLADAINQLADALKNMTESGDIENAGKKLGGFMSAVGKVGGWIGTAGAAVGRGASILGRNAAKVVSGEASAIPFKTLIDEGKELGKEEDRQAAASMSKAIARQREKRRKMQELAKAAAAEDAGKAATKATADAVNESIFGGQLAAADATAQVEALQEETRKKALAAIEEQKAAEQAAAEQRQAWDEETLNVLKEQLAERQKAADLAQQAAEQTVAQRIQEAADLKADRKEMERTHKREIDLEKKLARGVKLSAKDQAFLDARAALGMDLKKAAAAAAMVGPAEQALKDAQKARDKNLEDAAASLKNIEKQQAALLALK